MNAMGHQVKNFIGVVKVREGIEGEQRHVAS